MAQVDMTDLEKQAIEDGMMDALASVQMMAGGSEEERQLILVVDRSVKSVEGGVIAAKMNPSPVKKWLLPYCLVAGSVSVMVLNNHIHTAPKYQLIPPELAIFVVFACGIGLVFHAMKKQMT